MVVVFRRGKKFLSERYRWGNVPDSFPVWMMDGLLNTISNMPDKPTHYVLVEGDADLDKVEWTKLACP